MLKIDYRSRVRTRNIPLLLGSPCSDQTTNLHPNNEYFSTLVLFLCKFLSQKGSFLLNYWFDISLPSKIDWKKNWALMLFAMITIDSWKKSYDDEKWIRFRIFAIFRFLDERTILQSRKIVNKTREFRNVFKQETEFWKSGTYLQDLFKIGVC